MRRLLSVVKEYLAPPGLRKFPYKVYAFIIIINLSACSALKEIALVPAILTDIAVNAVTLGAVDADMVGTTKRLAEDGVLESNASIRSIDKQSAAIVAGGVAGIAIAQHQRKEAQQLQFEHQMQQQQQQQNLIALRQREAQQEADNLWNRNLREKEAQAKQSMTSHSSSTLTPAIAQASSITASEQTASHSTSSTFTPASTHSGGSMPIDEYGAPCIAVTRNTQTQKGMNTRFTRYDMTFENRCNRTITVAVKTNKGKYPTYLYIRGGTEGKTFCTDHLPVNSDCGGFNSWTANWSDHKKQ